LGKPNILLIDIETSPNLGYVWGKWEQNVMEFETEWYILCFAYKWLEEKRVKTVALPDFSMYKKDEENDIYVVKKLQELFDKADAVIAHNGDRFDIPRINTRFVYHNLPPPHPFKQIDTCKIARAKFGFNSNKLDDIGNTLGVGRKLVHTGFSLWKGCLKGDEKSWKMMRRYNAQDVRLLERVYLKLRPWATNHPNMNVITREPYGCPKCQSTNTISRGYQISKVGRRQNFQCKDCGGWSSSKVERVGVVLR